MKKNNNHEYLSINIKSESKRIKLRKPTRAFIGLVLSGMTGIIALPALAAPPDTGTVLQSVTPQPEQTLPSVPELEVIDARPSMQKHDSFKVQVSAFRITGSTVATEAELLQLVQLWVEQEMSLADLQKVTDIITSKYRDNGYFSSRAYLPEQEIIDGVVEISILEGRIADVEIKLDGEGRIKSEKVTQLVNGSVNAGDVAYLKHIERALLLVDDLPAVDAKATLVPGVQVGTSNLLVEATQKGMVDGSIDLDNFGNRYTGEARLGGTVAFNNPLRVGDQLTLRGLTAGSGLVYGRVSYVLPVGAAGTKIGTAYSNVNYALGEEFDSLDAEGKAQVFSLYALHPFVRGRNANFFVTAGVDLKSLVSEANGATQQDRTNNVYVLGATGDVRDTFLTGGLNTYSVSLSSGTLELDEAIDKSNDSVREQAAGSYNKIRFHVARLQRLTDSVSGYFALSGQFASKNLDSSEKFIVGGVGGVGAYPQGEAATDEAYMLNAEVRWDLPVKSRLGKMQLTAFVDTASVRTHKELWTGWESGNTKLKNEYTLSGAGVGFNISRPEDYILRLMLDFKIGDNDGADALGNDSDGTDDSSRVWLQMIKTF